MYTFNDLLGLNPLKPKITYIPLLPFIAAVGTVASIAGAKKQKDAEEVGILQARQYASEMFLMKSQAIAKSNQRIEEMNRAESQNIAAFSAMGRDDRSVDAFLKRNRELAGQDIANIETASVLEEAKYRTQASMSYVYGQNAAAGIRANGSINLLSNISSIAQSLPPLFATSSTATQISGPANMSSIRPPSKP